MALFRCASGGGAGGEITVTYGPDFYGATITCTKGLKTYSKTATSSGSVVFTVDEEGDWLIESTIEGVTYSVTATVTFMTTKELTAIPDGETVLPTDDIEKWLECAGIMDKSYTTLAEVLDDSETFNALLGDSNACAYMKRSTTWAVGLVPKMTSNTTPSGECTAISSYTDNPAFKAFDGDVYTFWNSTSSSITDVWIGYAFTQKTQISSYKILAGHSSYPATGVSYKLQGSDDAFVSDIHDIDTQSNLDFSDGKPKSFVASGNYRYYRVIYSAMTTSTTYKGITSLIQFYGGTSGDSITESQYAMNLLGQYDTACDALLSDSTWASAIANSTYWESVLQPLVPIMTSNTTPSGECIASEEYPDAQYMAYKAFDGNDSTGWYANSGSSTNQWIGYDFGGAVTIAKIKVRPEYYNGYARLKNINIQYSDDGLTYSGDNNLVVPNAQQDNEFALSDVGNNRYVRMFVADQYAPSSVNIGCATLQFYGRKSSGEKIHGGNPTYDSFYRIVDGNHVPVTDPSLLNAGTYTIYSNGLAKDTDNLSNDYGKTIRICPNTKEIVIRPDNSLYWYGVMLNSCEEMSTANGWSSPYGAFVSPTYGERGITLNSPSQTESGIASRYALSFNKICCLAKNTTDGLFLRINTTKNTSSQVASISISNTSMAKYEQAISSACYAWVFATNGREGAVDALWAE